MRVPGVLHAPQVARRKVAPSHHAVLWVAVRQPYDQPASSTVWCRSVPSHAPSPRSTTCVPSGLNALTNATTAIWSAAGTCPLGPWRTRQARGSARPLDTTWRIRATPPRPTPLPSMTRPSVGKARGARKPWAYGQQYPASQSASFATHRGKRVTRLSGWVPSGTCAATVGSWVLLLATGSSQGACFVRNWG